MIILDDAYLDYFTIEVTAAVDEDVTVCGNNTWNETILNVSLARIVATL